MKIGVAQIRSIKGDIAANTKQHIHLINLAFGYGADTIIFPELSLTGYEPELAAALATTPDDSRLDVFQEISNTRQVTIGVGLPTKQPAGTCITMVIFQPDQARQTYSKKYLHADEEEFFVSGQGTINFLGDQSNLALAICYELSVPEHAENAFNCGGEMYIASVAKTAGGVEKAHIRLAEIARHYAVPAIMANCIGLAGGMECAGRSAIWNNQGELLSQLNSTSEGILIFDTNTQEVIQQTL